MEHNEHTYDAILNAVTEESRPPVVTTSLLERTRDQYGVMGPDQKSDFWKATACTTGGIALTLAAYANERHGSYTHDHANTLVRATAYALDFADGYYAKRSISPTSKGAVTEFGCVADPVADKINNFINEAALVQSGNMHPIHPVIRTARDIVVSVGRRHVTKSSHGAIDVKANKFGKFNTLARDSVNLFASTALARRHHSINNALQTSVDVYAVASGAYTLYDLFKKSHKLK